MTKLLNETLKEREEIENKKLLRLRFFSYEFLKTSDLIFIQFKFTQGGKFAI